GPVGGLRPRLLDAEARAVRHLVEAVAQRLRADLDGLEEDVEARVGGHRPTIRGQTPNESATELSRPTFGVCPRLRPGAIGCFSPFDFRPDPRRESRNVRVFFATDIHGSETCWRKFLNSGTH